MAVAQREVISCAPGLRAGRDIISPRPGSALGVEDAKQRSDLNPSFLPMTARSSSPPHGLLVQRKRLYGMPERPYVSLPGVSRMQQITLSSWKPYDQKSGQAIKEDTSELSSITPPPGKEQRQCSSALADPGKLCPHRSSSKAGLVL